LSKPAAIKTSLSFILTEAFDMNNTEEIIQAVIVGVTVAYFLSNTNRVLKSIELCKECLVILKDKTKIRGEELVKLLYEAIYSLILNACSVHVSNDNTYAIEYAEKCLQICLESRDRSHKFECEISVKLAKMYVRECNYVKAREAFERALLVSTEIGDRRTEAACYGNIGAVYQLVGEYSKAKEHLEESLALHKDIGDRTGEASCYLNLGAVYQSVGEYGKARKHLEKSLAINKETSNRNGEASSHAHLGAVHYSVGEYHKAGEHVQKSLAINRETGNINGEASCYGNLGAVYRVVGEYNKARELLEISLITCYPKRIR